MTDWQRVQVSVLAGKGYRKFIGGRMFFLDADKVLSQRIAACLLDKWEELKASGRGWDDASIAAAKLQGRLAHNGSQTLPVASATASPTPAAPAPQLPPDLNPVETLQSGRMRLAKAVELYLKHMEGKMKSRQIGDEYYHGLCDRLGKMKAGFRDENDQPLDLHLDEINYERLDRMVQYFCARPPGQHSGKPISVQYVINITQSARQFFDWLDRTDRWLAPRKWRYAFEFDPRKLLSPIEKSASRKTKPKFTLEELVTLYKLATPGVRMFMGLGLLCGWTQKEIATLRRDHLVEKDGELWIDRLRNKTDVPGRWWVCPELAELMKKRMATTPENEGSLCFLTANGLPLVHRRQGGMDRKTDAVRLGWRNLMRTAKKHGVRDLPFSRLRKTGAQMVRNLGGLELEQAFLAHTPKEVAERHYAGRDGSEVGVGLSDFEKLEQIQRQIYTMLKPMFDAAQARKEKKGKNDRPQAA